ncbi:unnamed protein product [Chilo suppressalis]|uniref:Uncharacterized protein n=1 Tax=Chilo suppressalis TaxID=168631 RepID=A0ABN8AYG1_CHISP|nr:unnamed protein product [Chilo suppressalis]
MAPKGSNAQVIVETPKTADTRHRGFPATTLQQGEAGETWCKVVRKDKKTKKKAPVQGAEQSAQAAPTLSKKAAQPKRGDKLKKPKMKLPETAAVTLKLTPEAEDLGYTYTNVVEMARAAISLPTEEKADALASKLKETIAEYAEIERPNKTADLLISGLDDYGPLRSWWRW